jgi:predicted RNA-binding Zn-ribbon protein involved in translation (DUF1610 family)
MPSAFDFIRLPVPCPNCGQEDLQRLTDLLSSEEFTCLGCGELIDISSQEWRAFINQAAQLYKSIARPGQLG